MRKIKNIITTQLRDPDTQTASKHHEKMPKDSLDLRQKSIYVEHRQFLSRYKTQNQEKGSPSPDKSNSHQNEQQQIKPEEEEKSPEQSDEDRQAIQQKLGNIFKKVEAELLKSPSKDSPRTFKIFSDIITQKKDLQRISKERKFILSQNNRCFRYEEPKMSSPQKLPKEERYFDQIYEEQSMNRLAQSFSDRVRLQQEKLWGLHMLTKKMEQEKRELEEKRIIERKKMIRQRRILDKYKTPEDKNIFYNSRILQRSQTEQPKLLQESIIYKNHETNQKEGHLSQKNEFIDIYINSPILIKQTSEPNQQIQSIKVTNTRKDRADSKHLDFSIKKIRRASLTRNNTEDQPRHLLTNIKVNLDSSHVKSSKNNTDSSEKKTEKKHEKQPWNNTQSDFSFPVNNLNKNRARKNTNY